LERGYSLSLNKLESPSPKDNLCQVWLKLAQRFCRRRFLNDPFPFLHFCDYVPFGNRIIFVLYAIIRFYGVSGMKTVVFAPPSRPQGGRDHEIHNFCSSSPIDAISQIWLKLVQWFQRRS
jgi:hypothetical protein